jgi:hypothetical protein
VEVVIDRAPEPFGAGQSYVTSAQQQQRAGPIIGQTLRVTRSGPQAGQESISSVFLSTIQYYGYQQACEAPWRARI